MLPLWRSGIVGTLFVLSFPETISSVKCINIPFSLRALNLGFSSTFHVTKRPFLSSAATYRSSIYIIHFHDALYITKASFLRFTIFSQKNYNIYDFHTGLFSSVNHDSPMKFNVNLTFNEIFLEILTKITNKNITGISSA